MPPAISVIVVNFNSGDWLTRALQSLRKQSFADFEAIVLDNASEDNSLLMGQRAVAGDDRFRFLPQTENLGFARGCNLGALQARGEWLAMLNPDAEADPDWLAAFVRARAQFPDVKMFGSTQILADNPTRFDGVGDRYSVYGIAWRAGHGMRRNALQTLPETAFGPCGAGAFYHENVFDALDGYAEEFFCYMEDVDFALRARLMGLEARQIPDAMIYHAGGQGRNRDFSSYHGVRNSLWTLVRGMPGAILWPLFPVYIIMGIVLLAITMIVPQRRALARGIKDALRGLPIQWRARRRIQSLRRVTARQFARALVWNPLRVLRRGL